LKNPLGATDEVMMKRFAASAFSAMILFLFFVTQSIAEDPTAQEIVEKANNLYKGDQSYSKLTMNINTPQWQRYLQMEAWSKGQTDFFIRVLQPAKDQGTTFLKLGREMWNYVPSVDFVAKIPPSMMGQNWMGSDFTNEDISRADSVVTDYSHKLIGSETIDGADCWKIESTPKPEAPVVWGKMELLIQKDTYLLRKQTYFDQDMKKVKTLMASDIRKIQGRMIAMHLEMENFVKPGNKTVLIFDDMDFKKPIPESTFTKQNLRKMGN